MIPGILLAAGNSNRMGCNKLELPWRDSTVLLTTLARWCAVPELAEVLLVVRPGQTVPPVPSVRRMENPHADDGMGSSLRVASQAIAADAEAVVVGLADMPEVSTGTISALIQAWRPLGPKAIVAPVFQGRRGHPVVFGATHFLALQSLSGDCGARALLRGAGRDLHLLDVADPGVLFDLDTPADLELRP